MNKKYFFAMLVVGLVIAGMLTSCKQDGNVADAAEITATAEDEALAASINDDVTNEADEYISFIELNGYVVKQSASEVQGVKGNVIITVDKPDSVNFPKTITIDFGTEGFVGRRGNTLKGKLIVTVTNKMFTANSSRTITFDNFSVNGNVLAGSKTVTYNGLNAEFHPYWTISVSDTITRVDGTVVVWNSERTREHIENNKTPLQFWDDIYLIKGSSNGINAKGKTYTMTIDGNNPLIVGGGCAFIRKGSVTITSESKTVVVDYGNGDCDNIATATVDGSTREFKLSK